MATGKQWRTSIRLWDKLKPVAREMRHQPTEAESKLWQVLRGKQLDGMHFRRQHVIDRFVVDFYCATLRLVVEVDGEIHTERAEEDALRTEMLQAFGCRVLRFQNEDVLLRLDDVLLAIREAGNLTPSVPLSVHGEGEGGEVQVPVHE